MMPIVCFEAKRLTRYDQNNSPLVTTMSSDNRLLLAKCITLLYRESLLTDRDTNSADLVRTVLEKIKLPESSVGIDTERDVVSALRDTAIYLSAQVLAGDIDKDDLLQRVKLNCGLDDNLYESIRQGVDKSMDDGSLKRTILSIRHFINESFREQEMTALVNKAAAMLKFNREKIPDFRAFARALSQDIEPYLIESKQKDPALVDSVDLNDTDSVTQAYENVEASNSDGRIFKTGIQEFNEMLQGGYRAGETWIHSALQHNYKTGLNLTQFMDMALHNVPKLKVEGKKPLLLRISTEDSLASNLQFMYQVLVMNETGILPDMKKIKPAEVTEYVMSRMKVNGWHIKLMRINPSLWTYKNVQDTILKYEAEGYEVHVCFMDYLTMIQTTGCGNGVAGSDYQDMLQRLRNFFSARGILFVTPWQLSTEAQQLKREGRADLVKQLPGGGYYKGCKSLGQEPDGEFFHHIEVVNGTSYLTIHRGKHRLPTVIPDSKKYFGIPFPPSGPLLSDINKSNSAVRKLGGGAIGSGQEVPFFAYDD
jgi:hypothetical protein